MDVLGPGDAELGIQSIFYDAVAELVDAVECLRQSESRKARESQMLRSNWWKDWQSHCP